MINTFTELKNDVIVKLGITTTTAFWTDAILDDFIDEAYTWTTGYKKWPFTEKRDISANTSDETEIHTYPSDFKTDSIRILTVNDKIVRKVDFQQYLRFREQQSSNTKRIYSDFNRTYYINPNMDISGTIHSYGQYFPALDPTDETSTTVFSGAEEDGNEAISEKALEYARIREQKFNEAKTHRENAKRILDDVWDRIADEQYAYQPEGEGMWRHVDVVSGAYRTDLFRRDQF